MTLVFDDYVHLLGALLNTFHDLGKEGEVTGVIDLESVGGILFANGAQRAAGS